MVITAKYSLLPFFEVSQDYLCIAGYDGYFRKINPAFIEMIGYSEEELMSIPISELIYESDRERTAEYRDKLVKGLPLLNYENRYVTKSGEIVWVTWTSIPVESEGLIYAIAKNVTHLKKKEEERNALIANLTRLNRELKHFSFTATHDLRSPVNNLISLFSLMDAEAVKGAENQIYLKLLKQSVGSLKAIIDNYVDNLKEWNSPKINIVKVDLNLMMKKAVEPLKYLIQSSSTTFDIDFSEVNFITFNPIYLESIFLNLVSNSIKYSRPGISPVIKIKSQKKTGSVHIVFEDNGLGFNLEEIEGRVFGLNQTFHGHSESKGVGLYLVYNYLRELGGDIKLESEINRGSIFTLIIRD